MCKEEPAPKNPDMCEKDPVCILIGLTVKTILREKMMDVTSEMVKFRKNLFEQMLSVGDQDFFESLVEMEGLVDGMREGWKVWKKRGEDKEKASFEAFAKYLRSIKTKSADTHCNDQ